nr:hypothetical protein [Methylobacterium nonmethylotrophicum]
MRGLLGLARSLEGRTVVILLLAVLLVHGGALAIYRLSAAADEAFATEVARQLVIAREAVSRRPPEERADEAKALSSKHFEVGWERGPPAEAVGTDAALRDLRDRVLEAEPVLGPGLALALGAPDEPLRQRDLRGAFPLPDGDYLTFRSAHAPGLARLGPWAFLATAMAILVGVAAVVLVHRIAGPLRELTRATERIGRGGGRAGAGGRAGRDARDRARPERDAGAHPRPRGGADAGAGGGLARPENAHRQAAPAPRPGRGRRRAPRDGGGPRRDAGHGRGHPGVRARRR